MYSESGNSKQVFQCYFRNVSLIKKSSSPTKEIEILNQIKCKSSTKRTLVIDKKMEVIDQKNASHQRNNASHRPKKCSSSTKEMEIIYPKNASI